MSGDRGPTLPDDFAYLMQPVDRDRTPLRWSDIKGIEPSMPPPPVREPAYEAVYAVIRKYPPRSTDDYGVAVENARVWRAVEAALDAAGVPADDLAGYPQRYVISPERGSE